MVVFSFFSVLFFFESGSVNYVFVFYVQDSEDMLPCLRIMNENVFVSLRGVLTYFSRAMVPYERNLLHYGASV